jgi:hypothetical protein
MLLDKFSGDSMSTYGDVDLGPVDRVRCSTCAIISYGDDWYRLSGGYLAFSAHL